jgi:hypothetical protein
MATQQPNERHSFYVEATARGVEETLNYHQSKTGGIPTN